MDRTFIARFSAARRLLHRGSEVQVAVIAELILLRVSDPKLRERMVEAAVHDADRTRAIVEVAGVPVDPVLPGFEVVGVQRVVATPEEPAVATFEAVAPVRTGTWLDEGGRVAVAFARVPVLQATVEARWPVADPTRGQALGLRVVFEQTEVSADGSSVGDSHRGVRDWSVPPATGLVVVRLDADLVLLVAQAVVSDAEQARSVVAGWDARRDQRLDALDPVRRDDPRERARTVRHLLAGR